MRAEGHYFEPGTLILVSDAVTNGRHPRLYKCAAVSVGFKDDVHPGCCVFLEPEKHASRLNGTAYYANRHWYLLPDYRVQLLENPTDEQCALAMRILLTGYTPGVDDD